MKSLVDRLREEATHAVVPAASIALLNEAANALEGLKFAHDEWVTKTEWVQSTSQVSELGMHRADVLKQRITLLEAENAKLRKKPYTPDFSGSGYKLPQGAYSFAKLKSLTGIAFDLNPASIPHCEAGPNYCLMCLREFRKPTTDDLSPITHVAISLNGTIYSLPRPSRHHEIYHSIMGALLHDPVEGFLDEQGKFLTRLEAMERAIKTKQLNRRKGKKYYQGPELFSEDLW